MSDSKPTTLQILDKLDARAVGDPPPKPPEARGSPPEAKKPDFVRARTGTIYKLDGRTLVRVHKKLTKKERKAARLAARQKAGHNPGR